MYGTAPSPWSCCPFRILTFGEWDSGLTRTWMGLRIVSCRSAQETIKLVKIITKYPVTSSSSGGIQEMRRPSEPTRRRICRLSGGNRVRLTSFVTWLVTLWGSWSLLIYVIKEELDMLKWDRHNLLIGVINENDKSLLLCKVHMLRSNYVMSSLNIWRK